MATIEVSIITIILNVLVILSVGFWMGWVFGGARGYRKAFREKRETVEQLLGRIPDSEDSL